MTLLVALLLALTVPAAPAQQLFASAAVRVYADERSDARRTSSALVGLPPNVAMPAAYGDLVATMLQASPTFRAQCTRIAMADLTVVVRRSVLAPAQAAVTHIVRRDDGRIDAEVEVGFFGDAAMLLAHEFEHIVEQLDGVDLAGLANRPGTGVRTDPRNGQFETDRAIAIGQRVAREVSGATARR